MNAALSVWPARWSRQQRSTATIAAAAALLVLFMWGVAKPLSLDARAHRAGRRRVRERHAGHGLADARGRRSPGSSSASSPPWRSSRRSRRSAGRPTLYVWAVRGTPLLVQVLFVYFALPRIVPGLQLSDFGSAAVALAVNVGAYNAEAIRAGIIAIPKGQTEAARSLGLSPLQTFRDVVFPQAFKIALPPLVNNVVALLKDSSLAYVIGVVELSNVGNRLQAATFEPVADARHHRHDLPRPHHRAHPDLGAIEQRLDVEQRR